MSNSEDLAERIRARIGELQADIEAHERALAALQERAGDGGRGAKGAGAAPEQGPRQRVLRTVAAQTRVAAPTGARPRRRGRRPVVSADAVFAALRHVKSHD